MGVQTLIATIVAQLPEVLLTFISTALVLLKHDHVPALVAALAHISSLGKRDR
jgi:hypothetical protein